MNCVECHENLVAHMEGCLEPDSSRHCLDHLDACAACRAKLATITELQHHLVEAGQRASEVSISQTVMRRIQADPSLRPKESIMKRLLSGWGFPLSAVACAAAAITFLLVFSPGTQARAEGALAKGAQVVASLGSIHLRCKVRTQPDDNFPSIVPDQEFTDLEIWKQFGPEPKWRIEKPGRAAVMDGKCALLYLKKSNTAVKERPSMEAFDTGWLQHIADLGTTLNHELKNARAQHWKLNFEKGKAADGHVQSVVTILATSRVPEDDYLRNRYIDLSDTRRVYRFNAKSNVLENAQVFFQRAGSETLIFELGQIECNPSIPASLFHLELPADVRWSQEQGLQPGDEKYLAMSPEKIARSFFEACGRKDWKEAEKLDVMPLSEGAKNQYGGLEVQSIGQAFTSKAYPGSFVPYTIRLRSGEVKTFNLALRKDGKGGVWQVDGGY